MRRFAPLALACALALAIAGCFMPREFTAKLDVKKDGGYQFTYDGTIVCLLMLSDIENGKMGKDEERKAGEDIARDLEKDENFSDVSYMGDSIFKVSYAAAGNVNDAPMLVVKKLPLFALNPSPDGSRLVFQFLPGIDADELAAEFPASGLSPKGTIELTTELPVESSVGNPAKSMFSNTYTWNVDGIKGDLPAMTLKTR